MGNTTTSLDSIYRNSNAKTNSRCIVKLNRNVIISSECGKIRSQHVAQGETMRCDRISLSDINTPEYSGASVTFNGKEYFELWANAFDFVEWTDYQ